MEHSKRPTSRPHRSFPLLSLTILGTLAISGTIPPPTTELGPFAEPGGLRGAVIAVGEGISRNGAKQDQRTHDGPDIVTDLEERTAGQPTLEPARLGPFAEPGG